MNRPGRPHFPHILFEDNHVIAVHKPVGMMSQPNGSNAPDVLTELKAFIKERDKKPGNVFLGLVHRLDRPVGGVMLLAKTSKAASRLSAAFRERNVTKIYRAIIEGDAQQLMHSHGSRLNHFIIRDDGSRTSHIVDSGGKPAQLNWRVLEAKPHQSIVEIELLTGLPHQIRVQFAAVGHPIAADKKYGSKRIILNHPGVIALYCHRMETAHPTRPSTIAVTSAPPDELLEEFQSVR